MSLKRILFWLHKQAGIWLAIFFVLLGLTGSLLVFMHDLEPVIYKQYLKPVKPSVDFELATADSVIDAFKKQGFDNYRILRLYPPSIGNNVYRVLTSRVDPDSGDFKGDFLYHYISPYNSEYLGRHLVKTSNKFQWNMPVMRLLIQIHAQLMMGGIGALVIGLVGLVFFVTLLLGFYLWWPKNWYKAFSISWRSNTTRLMLDLHKQVGFWSGLVLLLITFTGIYHAFPDEFTSVVKKVLPYQDIPLTTEIQFVAEPVHIQSYIDYVNRRYPDARNMRVLLQDINKNHLTIHISQPNEINKIEGKTVLKFAYPKGELLQHYDPTTTPSGRRFINWMLPLHNGEALGLPGKILYACVGLMPLVLFITGFLVFYKKYRAKNKKGVMSFILAALK